MGVAKKHKVNSEFSNSKILFLVLKTQPFKVMVTGEKSEEYRTIGNWMNQRLFNKDGSKREYDYVKFVLGMGADNPFFICKFNGIKLVKHMHNEYSTGFEVKFDDEHYAIMLGDIVSKGNLNHRFLRWLFCFPWQRSY